MDATRRRWRRAAALAAVVSLAGAAQASAAITVTTTADTIDDADPGACLSGGACTLRQAIFAARGADQTIVLAAGTYVLNFGELAIQQDAGTLTVRGAGAGRTTIDQQSFPSNRVLRVIDDAGAAALADLTITHGDLRGENGADGTPGDRGGPGDDAVGGGILNEGDLTLTDVVVTDNAVTGGRGGSGGAAAGAGATPGAGGAGGMGIGGGIANQGTLLLRRVSVVANHAAGGEGGAAGTASTTRSGGRGGAALGAGVHNDGALTVEDATVGDNVSTGGDGGLGNLPGVARGDGGEAAGGGLSHLGSSLEIAASTIGDNAAIGGQGGVAAGGYGGGLALFRTFALTRSTLAGNTAATGRTELGPNAPEAVGGGLYAAAAGTVDATTFFENRTSITLDSDATEGVGGSIGVYTVPGTAVTLRSSLLAYGDGAPGTRNCVGNVNSGGGNVASTDASECGLGAGDTPSADLDALPDLADNGGPTETVALPAGSPALNAGSCAAAATDQRGMTREGTCDAGAFERTVPQIELQAPRDMLTNAATLKALLRDTSGATYEFSYGLADAGEHPLGVRSPAATGTTPVAIEQALSGLAEGQTYKYRLVVRGADGDASAEGTFRTAIKGPPPPVPGPDPGPGRQLPPTPTPPVLSKLSAAPRSFQVRKARRHGRKRRVSGGTTVRFTLDTAATVSARVELLQPARRGAKPKAKVVGTLSLGSRKAGVSRVAFGGRVGRRTLAPGRYRFTLTAQNGALRSRAVTLVLVVRRG